MKTAYLLVFDGLSDWEPGLALAEINKSNEYQVKTVGFNREIIKTMGGVSIVPDFTTDTVNYNDAAILILPTTPLTLPGPNKMKKHRVFYP